MILIFFKLLKTYLIYASEDSTLETKHKRHRRLHNRREHVGGPRGFRLRVDLLHAHFARVLGTISAYNSGCGTP